MSKELWIDAYEQLAEEYLDEHPEATQEQAYKYAEDRAHGRMIDNIAGHADYLRDQAKYK